MDTRFRLCVTADGRCGAFSIGIECDSSSCGALGSTDTERLGGGGCEVGGGVRVGCMSDARLAGHVSESLADERWCCFVVFRYSTELMSDRYDLWRKGITPAGPL